MPSALLRIALCALGALVTVSLRPSAAKAEVRAGQKQADGAYDRFDGDLDLGVGLGLELGSAGRAAPVVRGSAHYFSMAGVYAAGRVRTADASAPSLFALGVDLRPLFVPRWSKGFETGPALKDLTLDSLSLSLGAFWFRQPAPGAEGGSGFEAGLGFGLPLLARAKGPWLDVRGLLRYPDGEARQEAVVLLVGWHGFVTTPFSAGSGQ